MIKGGKQDQHRRHAHDHVKVSDHEIGIGQGHIDHHVAEEQTGQTAVDKSEDEADGKIHRHVHADITFPQGQHPVIDFQCRRHCNNQRGGGEEEAKVGVHTAHVHVVCPDHKTETTDGDDRPHHHAITKNILASVGTQHIRHQAEGG